MHDATPNIAEADQLDAAIATALELNGLQEIERTSLAPDWIAAHTAAELEEALIQSAARIASDGALQVLIATPVSSDGAIAYSIVAAKRAEPAPE